MNKKTDGQELTGLARGGQRIKTCRDTYVKSLEGLIKLASLQVKIVVVVVVLPTKIISCLCRRRS